MPDTQSSTVMSDQPPYPLSAPDPRKPYTPDPNVNAGLPPIAPPPASSITQEKQPSVGPQVLPGSKGAKAASIAFGLDAVLRGAMKGRDDANQKRAYQANRLMQGFQQMYKSAGDQYIGMLQNNPELAEKMYKLSTTKDPAEAKQLATDPDVMKAQDLLNQSNSARAAVYKIYNGTFAPKQKSSKSKSKSGGQSDDQQNPIMMAQSKDPVEKLQGMMAIGAKVGNPYALQGQYLMSPDYQAQVKQRKAWQAITGSEQTLEAGNVQDKIYLRNMETNNVAAMAPEQRAEWEKLTPEQKTEKMQSVRDRLAEVATGYVKKQKVFETKTSPDHHKMVKYQSADGSVTDWIDEGPVAAPASTIAKPGSEQAFVEQWARENGISDPKTIPSDVQRQLKQAWNAGAGGTTIRSGQVLWTDTNGNTWKIPISSTTTRTGTAMPKATPPAWSPGAKLEGSTAGAAPAAGAISTTPPPVKGAQLIGKKNLTPEEKLQNAIRQKDHTAAKKIIDDAKKDYDGALTRVDTMDKNLKAAENGDQQAMLSLVANHIGMTLGAQKGARITRAVWDEAVESAPWLQVKINKWFHTDPSTGDMIFDGYKSGVTLTPEQMQQMVRLAHEKVDTLKKNIPVLENLYKKDLEAAPSSGGMNTPSGPHAVDSILDDIMKPKT